LGGDCANVQGGKPGGGGGSGGGGASYDLGGGAPGGRKYRLESLKGVGVGALSFCGSGKGVKLGEKKTGVFSSYWVPWV